MDSIGIRLELVGSVLDSAMTRVQKSRYDSVRNALAYSSVTSTPIEEFGAVMGLDAASK